MGIKQKQVEKLKYDQPVKISNGEHRTAMIGFQIAKVKLRL